MNISQLEANFAIRSIFYDYKDIERSPLLYMSFFLFSETEELDYASNIALSSKSMISDDVWIKVYPNESMKSTELITSVIRILYDRLVGK